MTDELKTKLEGYVARTASLEEQLRLKDVKGELDALVKCGRVTPAMSKLAESIMMAGDPIKVKQTITLKEGEKPQEVETSIKALFTEFITAMPKEWSVNMKKL